MTPAWHHRQQLAQLDRRALALSLVPRVFWWTAAAAGAASVGVLGVVAHEVPGQASPPGAATDRTSAGSTPTSGHGSSTTTAGSGAGASSGDDRTSTAAGSGSIDPPTTTLVPTTRSPVAVSGGTSR